jgi:predicted AAA+ superfamily ATPase
VAYLVEAFLFMSVTRYSPKAKLRMTAQRKIYGYDMRSRSRTEAHGGTILTWDEEIFVASTFA